MVASSDFTTYWKLDEASGNRADTAGTSTLTDNNTVTAATGILHANAANFVKANSEYLSAVDSAELSTGDIDFSLIGWFYYDILSDGVDFPAPVLKASSWADGSVDYGFVHNSSLVPRFVANTRAGVDWGSTLSTGQWYMIAGYHDAGNNEVGISVNAGTYVTAAMASGGVDTAAALNLGKNLAAAGFTYFDGRMQGVGLLKNYLLTQADLTFLYNGGTGLPWPFATQLSTTIDITAAMTAVVSANKYQVFSSNVPKTTFKVQDTT